MLGTSNKPLIVVDADALISFVYVNDANHTRAKTALQHLATTQSSLLYPTTAILEAVTALKGKLNRPEDAKRIVEKLQSGEYPIQAVDQAILNDAAALFNPLASKKHTLFDAVIAAIGKQLSADAIFSFDKWYTTQGLTLAEDFIVEGKQAA
jgi:predicted nucleic acid-binding protein